MITKQGTVVTKSGDQTVKVEVNTSRSHAKYIKKFKVTKSFLVHDEKNVAVVGDKVLIQQCVPVSKRKHWKLVEITK